MNPNFLDFEQPIAELESKINELRSVVKDSTTVNFNDEIKQLKDKSLALTQDIFSKLSSWQISQLARHPKRPYTLDYVERIFTEFDELHGDRTFGDDKAIIGGTAAWLRRAGRLTSCASSKSPSSGPRRAWRCRRGRT